MILVARPNRPTPGSPAGRAQAPALNAAPLPRPVLQHRRSPQQLCLDLRQR